jgi:basic membrane protein A
MDGSSGRVNRVSVVAAEADRETNRLIAGFERGLRETNPDALVRVDYSHELDDPTACERLANRQIDEGADVVLALSGRCGLGASEVARIRGVWSVGAEEDGILPRPHVLVSTRKDMELAALFAVSKLVQGALPMGRDTVLGLEDDYSVMVEFSQLVDADIDSAVVHRCSAITATRHRDI